MNEFDRGLILGAAHNVTVERILNEVRLTRKFTMTMSCAVFDENEQEVSDVSTTYTKNMVNLRVFYVFTDIVGNYDTHLGGTFNAVDGTEFTGQFYDAQDSTDVRSYALGILSYSPAVYLSTDGSELSRNDYTLPDDALSISYETIDTTVYTDNWTQSTIHTYFTNETDEDITVNKVLITGLIGDSSVVSYECLLFEELLDEPITIKAGERWARDYSFRLSI